MPIVNFCLMDLPDDNMGFRSVDDNMGFRIVDIGDERHYYRHPANVPRLAGSVSRRPGVVGPSGASRIGYVPSLPRSTDTSCASSGRTILGY